MPNYLLLNNLIEVPPGRYRYHQTETKTDFGPYSDFDTLASAVRVHRKTNKLDPGDALEKELQTWLCQNMANAGYYCHEEGEAVVRVVEGGDGTEAATGWDGSKKWAELHRYALHENSAPHERDTWLTTFTASIPCGACRRHWKMLTREKPLPYHAAADEFFVWTVDRHNDVNREIQKPEMDVDTARDLWSK